MIPNHNGIVDRRGVDGHWIASLFFDTLEYHESDTAFAPFMVGRSIVEAKVFVCAIQHTPV